MLAGAFIEPDIVTALLSFRQQRRAVPEAGGLLLGFRRPPFLHVTDFTSPLPLDRRTRNGFVRCDPGHGERAIERWQSSNHQVDIVGEWHTHPEHRPFPSPIDLADWRKTCEREPLPRLFLVIGIESLFFDGVATLIDLPFPCHSFPFHP